MNTSAPSTLARQIFPRQPPLGDNSSAQYEQARRLLARQDAVLIAHYYTAPAIQDLALESGGCVADSLEMARYGCDHRATTLMVAGVRFMGESAKILSPDKRVLMPTLKANCSLDIGCSAEEFATFRAQYPERTVVVYANTSAAVKAQADWVVTSSVARDIVNHLDEQGEKILWAPDKYLGDYIQRETGADMVLWDGACIVHEEFKAEGLRTLRTLYPDAAVLAHPESPRAVLELADMVGSTSQIIQAAAERPEQRFIVATDRGIFHQLHRRLPNKEFLVAPTAGEGATCRSCARCPWMAMNSLEGIANSLKSGANEVQVSPELCAQALRPLQRMLNFAATHLH